MPLKSIDVSRAKALLREGAILVDIRDADEHAREKIAAACNIPLSKMNSAQSFADGKTVIFHCKSGQRTKMNVQALHRFAGPNGLILEGGIDAWKAAALSTTTDKSKPIEIMRQVQITAGSIVLGAAILGAVVSPAFYAVSAAVGAGLMISGLTGSCAMAKALRVMPWNRLSA